jgi:hypothetical protein
MEVEEELVVGVDDDEKEVTDLDINDVSEILIGIQYDP